MRFLKYVLRSLPVVLGLGLLAMIVAWSGIINVSAVAAKDEGLMDRVLKMASARSIVVHADAGANPWVHDPATLDVGLKHYKANCFDCHGAPGMERREFAAGLNPPAPHLTLPDIQEMTDGELFWVVSNGIRMTGMPAFSVTHSEEEIWKIVAFVRLLPRLSAEQKAALEAGRDGEEEHHHGEQAPSVSAHEH